MENQELIIKRDVIDNIGWTIPKGTRVFILKELVNPVTKKEMLIIQIDNGTGINKLMPRTLIEKEKLK
jgi:hypothetical protein